MVKKDDGGISILLHIPIGVTPMQKEVFHSFPTITKKDIAAVVEVLKSGQLVEGKLCLQLCNTMAKRYHAEFGLTTSSGYHALLLALKACGVSNGSTVALPTYVCHEVLLPVFELGGVPVFLDTKMDFSVVIPEKLECDVIILPHLFGIWHDYSSLVGRFEYVIEDFAQCILPDSLMKNGLIGNYGIFSFHATKVITSGEGGLVLAQKGEDRMRLESITVNRDTGLVYRPPNMSDLAAAFLLSQLSQLNAFYEQRFKIARLYDEKLKNHSVVFPCNYASSYFRYLIHVDNIQLEDIIEHLKSEFVHVRKPVCKLAHTYVKCLSYKEGTKKMEAKRLIDTTLSLPIYPKMAEGCVEKVASALLRYLSC